MKKCAFTLSEVLITLGIIGVVAAMTIPNLISTHKKKQTVAKLQKAISVINQAYRLSFDEVGEPESAFELGALEYFKTYWEPYIKISTYCDNYKKCHYKESTPWRYLGGDNVKASVTDTKSRTSFISMDNVFYIIYTANYPTKDDDGNLVAAPFYWVLIDLNAGEGPNVVGKDTFLLTRVQENGGGVQPLGYKKSSQDINKNCKNTTGNAKGQYCAEKIRRAGWNIEKDYPWK